MYVTVENKGRECLRVWDWFGDTQTPVAGLSYWAMIVLCAYPVSVASIWTKLSDLGQKINYPINKN